MTICARRPFLCLFLVILFGAILPYLYLHWDPKVVPTKMMFGKTKQDFNELFGRELDKTRESSIKVIGCGWSRSGTASTKIALEELGYKVYHYTEILNRDKHRVLWENALRTESESDIDLIVEALLEDGFNATLDWPAALFCLDIFARFPESKVLLNVRDTAAQWFRSFKALIHLFSPMTVDAFPLSFLTGPIASMDGMILRKAQIPSTNSKPFFSFLPWVKYHDINLDPEGTMAQYSANIETVKSAVPEEQLLVFNVKQGWPPMCEFLGLSNSEGGDGCPPGEFPHSNSKMGVKMGAVSNRVLVVTWPIIGALLALLFTWFVYRRSCSMMDRLGRRRKETKEKGI